MHHFSPRLTAFVVVISWCFPYTDVSPASVWPISVWESHCFRSTHFVFDVKSLFILSGICLLETPSPRSCFNTPLRTGLQNSEDALMSSLFCQCLSSLLLFPFLFFFSWHPYQIDGPYKGCSVQTTTAHPHFTRIAINPGLLYCSHTQITFIFLFLIHKLLLNLSSHCTVMPIIFNLDSNLAHIFLLQTVSIWLRY